jgi:hypothetical protein
LPKLPLIYENKVLYWKFYKEAEMIPQGIVKENLEHAGKNFITLKYVNDTK